MTEIRVLEYLDPRGRSPFARWFDELSSDAAARVAAALYRLEAGNFSNVKGVGRGVLERRIDFGPGYRIYFGKDGETLIVLLGGMERVVSRKPLKRPRNVGSNTGAVGAWMRKEAAWL